MDQVLKASFEAYHNSLLSISFAEHPYTPRSPPSRALEKLYCTYWGILEQDIPRKVVDGVCFDSEYREVTRRKAQQEHKDYYLARGSLQPYNRALSGRSYGAILRVVKYTPRSVNLEGAKLLKTIRTLYLTYEFSV